MQIKSIISFVSKLSKREQIIFYVTLGIVCLVIMDRMMLTPILAKISKLNETIQAKEEGIQESLIMVTQEKRIEGETKKYSTFLSKPQKEEKMITEFLKDVESLAKKSSVYLIDIKPSGKNVDGHTSQYFVKLNFEAQMEQVVNFFYSVTNFEQLINIESYQISPKTIGSSIIRCSMSISKVIVLE